MPVRRIAVAGGGIGVLDAVGAVAHTPESGGIELFDGQMLSAPPGRSRSRGYWSAGDRFGIVPISGDRVSWSAVSAHRRVVRG